MSHDNKFKIGDKVVYPSHGVGEIQNITVLNFAGIETKVYVILFLEKKMTLHIPLHKALALRAVVDFDQLKLAYDALRQKPQCLSKIGTKKNQELEIKLKSGDLRQLAEIVRDLYKPKSPNKTKSYSEGVFFASALSKLSLEAAIIENASSDDIIAKIEDILNNTTISEAI